MSTKAISRDKSEITKFVFVDHPICKSKLNRNSVLFFVNTMKKLSLLNIIIDQDFENFNTLALVCNVK